ncbi:hypothetical protein C2869_13180 [Saccharobesus litoralis]|uniref:Nitrogen fixation protein FixH n=1 Tax=Saccharobesus litoralis TaxID=2172099 RepID=A0A2S0VSZ9_9ALTE|nr:FixH family protein [Saccharobesus litoralis]AWB67334.1 hypothetical protein C2869_13180 [Saccharobesus litoralis]
MSAIPSNQQEPKRPWYKEPWTWFLIILPFTSVTAAVYMISTFNTHNVEMVVDDYYKKGKAINQELGRIKLAKSYGLSAIMRVEQGKILLDVNKNAQAPELAALSISFYHSTLSKRDFQVMATQRANGLFQADASQLSDGNWQVTVEPHDKSWKIQHRITVPLKGEQILIPR